MVARHYEDFRVEMSRHGERTVESRVTSAEGETTTPVRTQLDDAVYSEMLDLAVRLESKRINQDELLTLGQLLARYLLPADVRALFLRGLDRSDDRTGVRLRIVCHDRELSMLPWEYTYVRRSSEYTKLAPFLSLDQRISIVRHEPHGTPLPSVRPLTDGHLRVLVAAARRLPGEPDLLGDDDFGAIRHALAEAVRNVNVQLVELPEPVTEGDLRDALRQPVDILQFIGHGLGPAHPAPGLLLSDGVGGTAVLAPEILAELLKAADVRIAVLSSCYSGLRAGKSEWAGVAAAVVQVGVPAVVAMQHAIESSHSLVFERGFYSAIAAGLTLDEAVALGRRKITELGVLAEWGVPVLYTRSDGVLFSRVPGGAFADELRREMQREPVDLSSGLELESRGDWGKAVEAYMRLIPSATGQREACHLRLRIGACLWRDGESDEAEEHLATARRIAVEIGDRHLLGEVLLEQGRRSEEDDHIDEAAKRYEEAASAFESAQAGDNRPTIRLASIDRRRGDLRQALARLQAEDLDPESMSEELRAEYLDVLGSVYLARGQYPLAIETLNEALQLDERVHTEHVGCSTRLLLAEAFLGRGDRDAALRQVDIALDTYEETRDESGLSEAWVMKGQIHEDAGDYQSALRAYGRASQYDAAGRDTGGEARANRLLGRTALKRGDADAAEDYFNRAHDLLLRSQDDLEKAALLVEEAYLDLEEGEYRNAISKLRLVLKTAEDDEDERAIAIAKRHLAAAIRESGDLQTAASLLQDALVTLQDRDDLRELEALLDDLGEVYLEQGEFEKAIEHLTWSLRLDEELDTGSGRARSMLLLGRVHARFGERQQAGEYFESAFDIYRRLNDSVGESDARHELGQWYTEEGETRAARDHLQQALRIDRVQEDRLGTVRCHRALAALYRRDGNWARADEHLADALSELGTTPDPIERSLLLIEDAELSLSRGDNRGAVERASMAKKDLVRSGSVVEAATCNRIIGRATARIGECDRAVTMLQETQAVFAAHRAQVELNRTYDDLAEVFLLKGDLPSARNAIQQSLDLDKQSGWCASRGRSLLLLGEIEERASKVEAARDRYEDALNAFRDAKDEVGQAEVHLRLGTWHLDHNGQLGAALDQAIRELKTARRLFQAHQDLRGMSRSFRKLGEVYFDKNEPQRAEEAFEQAEDCLHSLRSDREMAPLAFVQGRLYASQGHHDRAISCFDRSLALYREMHREDRVHEVLRRLATAHQNVGDLDKALDCIRQIGLEQSRIWRVLVDNLHEDVSSVSSGAYREGAYDTAVRRAIDALRSWLSRSDHAAVSPEVRGFAESIVALSCRPEARVVWEASSLEAVAIIASAHVVLSLADLGRAELAESDPRAR